MAPPLLCHVPLKGTWSPVSPRLQRRPGTSSPSLTQTSITAVRRQTSVAILAVSTGAFLNFHPQSNSSKTLLPRLTFNNLSVTPMCPPHLPPWFPLQQKNRCRHASHLRLTSPHPPLPPTALKLPSPTSPPGRCPQGHLGPPGGQVRNTSQSHPHPRDT